MLVTHITFSTTAPDADRDSRKNIVESYLASLLKDGQICGDYLVAWSGGKLNAFTHIARPDAFEEQHHSDWSLRELNAVVDSFGQRPEWTVIDDDVPKEFPNWQSTSSLHLFTHAFDDSSPICCGDTGRPIPLYLLPINQQDREALYFWSRSYKYHDKICFDCSTLEIPAYTEMADPTSELAMKGRQLCAEVERATKVPTYYFMHRYWGRSEGESERPCPVCGGQWHQTEITNGSQPFHQFHFRCEPCRLVSNRGASLDDEPHAQIGEYKDET